MLDIRDKKLTATEYQVTATSITADLPAYESGDELWAFVVTGNTTALTGPGGTWAEWGASATSGSKRLSVWHKTAGSSESSPVWSIGATTYWEVIIFSIIGYSSVDSGGSARYNFTTQTAQNTSALGALSATSNDSLVFDVCMVASAGMFPTVEDNSIYVDANETISTALGFFVGHRAVAAGSIPDINWRFDAARTGTILRITLTPAATGGVPVSANTLPRILRHYGMLDSYTFTDADTALSLGGAGINGIPVETTVPASELSTNLATATDFKAQSSRLTMSTTYTFGTVKWNGPIDTFSTVQDCTGVVFDVHIGSNFTASQIGPSGPIYIFGDDATPPNWVAYSFGSRSEVNTGGNYAAFSRRIAAGSPDFYAASDGTGAAMQWDRLKYAGPLIPRNATSGTTYIYLWKFSIISGCELVGGSADFPINHSRIREALASGEAIHDASLLQGTKQLVIEASIRLGDGVTPSHIDLSQGSIETPASTNTKWKGLDDSINIELAPDGTCSIASNVFRANTPQKFTLAADSATDATWLTEAASFIGPWDWRNLATNADLAQITWSGARKVYLGTADHTFLTIDATTASGTDSAAANASGNGSLTDGSIDGTGAEYALELDAAVTAYSLTNVGLTAGSVGKLHILDSNALNTVTITISGTTALVDADITSDGAGWTIDAPAVTRGLNFTDLVAGTQVKVFNTGTDVERFSTDSSGTSETWSEATTGSVTVDYTIMQAGYRPIRVTGVTVTGAISGGVLATPIQQQIDRAYVASSGLTYATNTTATAGATKQFGLTTDSTLQNYYSHMIEVWIAQGAEGGDFANTQFPITPNGSTSFSFDYGWEWDGSTSIAHLSRDGMRYKNASGTVTAIWAAILTSGVPAGLQVRYQQQDGLGTTNAANTGNMDQLVQIYGDATHGNFDYTDWLVLKVQAAGYDQAEAVAADIYGTLEDQLYVFGLTPLPDADATWVTDATVTVTAEPTPVEWPAASGKFFSTTITDTTDGHSGLQILRAVRGENEFNWSDLVRPNGSKFKTVTGNFYGDAFLTPAGVRVVLSDGTTPHPDFDLFSDDTAADPYVPPQSAPITWASCPTGATVLLYNDSDAGAIIDTQIGVTGGYSLAITLPHVDVAVGDTLRLRYGHADYYAGELQGTMTADGLAFVGTATSHPIYAAWGLTGADYDQANGGPYTMDGANLQIDISVAGTVTGLKTQLAAWTQYLMTRPAGLDAFFGAWDLLATNQIRQNVSVVDVLLDLPTAGAVFTLTDNNVNYYRSDFSYPAYVGTGHGLVAMTYDASPFVATVAGGDVVTGTPETVAAAVRAALNTELTRISDLAKRGGVVSGTPVVIPPGDGSIVAGDVEIGVSTAEDGTVTLARV